MSVPIQFPGFRKNEPTAAGRAIVTAADAEAQRVLLDVYSQAQVDAAIGAVPVATRDSLGLDTDDTPTFAGINTTGNATIRGGTLDLSSTANGGARVYVSGVSLMFNVNGGQSRMMLRSGSDLIVSSSSQIGWAISSSLSATSSSNTGWHTTAGGVIEQRSGASSQKYRLFKTYASATSGEWLEQDAISDESFFRIDACIGLTGGSIRGLKIGTKSGAGTPTDWIICNTNGTTIIKPPTTDPGISGALWNDSGTLKISAG